MSQPMLLGTVPQVVGVLCLLWPLYWIGRRFLSKTTLDNVPGPSSDSWLIGNLATMFDRNAWKTHRIIEEKYGSVMRFHGLLGEKQLYISDPKALYYVYIKEHENYIEPEAFYVSNALHFGNGIFNYQGEMHRKQRRILNSAFSVAHMREMTPLFYEITNKVKTAFATKVANGPQEIEVLNWMTRTALELIGEAGLGFSFDTLTDADEGSPYAKAVKELFPTEAPLLPAAAYLLPTLVKIGTPRLRRFVVDILPWKKLHQVRDTIDIMHKYAVKIYDQKKRAFEEGNEAFLSTQAGGGKDIITKLVRANMSPTAKDKISDDEVIGNMSYVLFDTTFIPDSGLTVNYLPVPSGLIFAAMDTTSSALARTLHTLATHPDVQNRLRLEIDQAIGDNTDLTYDELADLPLLDAICKETMRLFTPVTIVPRRTATNTILPLATPITGVDGKQINEIPIPANTSLYTSVLSSNRNPNIWGPDSYEWKPERWLQPLPETVKDAPIPGIYPHLMTFLGGPNSCLGFTFAQLEMKVVLSVLIRNFRFQPCSRDKKIVWETPGISSPSLVIDGERITQLPLVVTAMHPA